MSDAGKWMKLKHLKVAVFFLLVPCGVFFAVTTKPKIESVWFSEVTKQPKGYSAQELIFSGVPCLVQKELDCKEKNGFLLARISLNQSRGWEETRLTGNWFYDEGKIVLHGKYCRVFATTKLHGKWALIRAFDCDHHLWEGMIQEGKLVLTETLEFSGDMKFRGVSNSQDEKMIHGIVLDISGNEFSAWGIDLKKTRKTGKASRLDSGKEKGLEVLIKESIDSTGRYAIENNLNGNDAMKPGDLIQIKNPPDRGILD